MDVAIRLANTFEELKKGQVRSLDQAWATHLQTPVHSSEYFVALAAILSSMENLQREINQSDLSDRAKGLYLGATNKLSPLCNPAIIGSQKTNAINTASDAIDLLHLASDALDLQIEHFVNPITIDALIEEILSIKGQISDIEIDTRFREFLISQLDLLLVALRGYSSLGIEGLSKIFGSVAFELARAPTMAPMADTETKREWLSKTIGFVKKVGQAVIWVGAVTGGADAILTNGTDVLEHLGAVQPEGAADDCSTVAKADVAETK